MRSGEGTQDAAATVEWHKATVASPPAGAVLVWDPIYAARNAHGQRAVTLDEVRAAGWVALPEVDERLTVAAAGARKQRRPAPDPEAALSGGEGWHVFRSPESASR